MSQKISDGRMILPYHNVKVEHWNPGASAPLTLPIHVICNTSDEQIYCNIHTNSHAQPDWIKAEPAHNVVAILCGSGPSLKDDLPKVRAFQEQGGKVFALNGAAKFLAGNAIYPDYQVILDARPETGQLIGPAREHLFASQVAPELFAKVPMAKLWQLQVHGIDFVLPDEYEAHALIGGAASVGNTAICLVYAMGYRDLQIFGYDSSHRDGHGHAFHQKMNDGDPCAIVSFRGVEYTASLTMKLQAEKFQETARALQDLGCTLTVHGDGLLPALWNAKFSEDSERAKYRQLWANPSYRQEAPGEHLVADAIQWLGVSAGSAIDFGCGTGRGARAFQRLGFDVRGVDFADNCLDADVQVPLTLACLWDLPDLKADIGYCTDVMEHIPPDHVDAVIHGVMRCVPQAFFNISLVADAFGETVGEPLHLSVHSFPWWIETFTHLGYEVRHSREDTASACFHVMHPPAARTPCAAVSGGGGSPAPAVSFHQRKDNS